MNKLKVIQPKPSIDLLIYSLKHHAPERTEDDQYDLCKNPFEEIDANAELNRDEKNLDYDTDDDSDKEDALIESTWGDADQEFSDVQNIDQTMEYSEIIERAGVYTAEEVLKASIEKARKLHSLYSGQLEHLRQIYIDKKRTYLQELKKEKELYCSIHNQKKSTVDDMLKYKQLKALMAYGRKHRIDAILAKREHEKRISCLSNSKQPTKSQKTYKCHFLDDGVRCFGTCVPLTKFCIRHILMDKRQVLFKPCNAPYNNTTCSVPVLSIYADEHCIFHSTFKPEKLKTLNPEDYEIKLEEDETIKEEETEDVKDEKPNEVKVEETKENPSQDNVKETNEEEQNKTESNVEISNNIDEERQEQVETEVDTSENIIETPQEEEIVEEAVEEYGEAMNVEEEQVVDNNHVPIDQ